MTYHQSVWPTEDVTTSDWKETPLHSKLGNDSNYVQLDNCFVEHGSFKVKLDPIHGPKPGAMEIVINWDTFYDEGCEISVVPSTTVGFVKLFEGSTLRFTSNTFTITQPPPPPFVIPDSTVANIQAFDDLYIEFILESMEGGDGGPGDEGPGGGGPGGGPA